MTPDTGAEHRFTAMGTSCHVVVRGDDARPRGAAAALRTAEDEVRRLEALWSRFVDDSDVTRLNDAAGAPVAVHPDTLALLHAAVDATDWTHGWFDPFMQRDIVAAGYDRTFATLPVVDALVAQVSPPVTDDAAGVPVRVPARSRAPIVLDDAAGTAQLAGGVGFDPGAIGKGFAADRVATMLCAGEFDGVSGALVNVGGDLRCAGSCPTPPGQDPPGWRIGIDDPFDPAAPSVTSVRLVEGGLATSTPLKRRWRNADGETAHHVLDPRSRRPSTVEVASVSVIAHEAWRAEVLATAVLLAGPVEGAAMLRAADGGAVVVTLDGTVRQL